MPGGAYNHFSSRYKSPGVAFSFPMVQGSQSDFSQSCAKDSDRSLHHLRRFALPRGEMKLRTSGTCAGTKSIPQSNYFKSNFGEGVPLLRQWCCSPDCRPHAGIEASYAANRAWDSPAAWISYMKGRVGLRSSTPCRLCGCRRARQENEKAPIGKSLGFSQPISVRLDINGREVTDRNGKVLESA